MVSTTLVNRSVDDPRRLVTVDAPRPARRPARRGPPRRDGGGVRQLHRAKSLAIYVQVGELTEKTAWLHVVAYAPFGADVSHVASEIREQAVAALGAAELLPA